MTFAQGSLLTSFCLTAVLTAVAPAHAQLTPAGSPTPAASGGTAYARTADTGYDPQHDVFLMVTTEHQTGRVFGSFANSSGAAVGAGFRIDTTGAFPFGPAVAYSPAADVFLVIWVNDKAEVRGRLVRYGAGAIGSDVLIGTGGRKTWAPAIAYSPTSQEFLVSWSSSAGPNWIVRVSTGASTLGAPLQTTGVVWTQEPALAWNPTNNEFLLVYAQEINPGWQVRVQRVAAGQLVGGPVTIHAAGSTKMPDVAYATASGKFLVTWFQGSPYGIYGRLLNPDASAAGSVQPMLPSNFGSYDANSLAYNDATDTFVTASITPQPNVSLDTIGGAEVSNGGVPSTAMRFVEAAAGTGHRRYPEVAASDNNARFLTIFNKQQSTFWGQLLNTATGGGGGQPPPPPPPPPGHVQTTTAEADFSGDSLPDLLWRRSDGLVAYWRMSGLAATATVFLTGADPSWSIAGTGDLNGDGKPEIIWRHQAGHVFAWFVNGNTLAGGSYLNPSHVDTSWRLAAVADINLDGRADLLWQQTTGALYVWYMNGATMASVAPLSPGNAGGDWQLKGAGDLNGDGRPDLVWQSPSSGAFAAWIMNGAAASKMEWLSPTHVGSDWALRAVVDLTGDGKSDIVWQHSTGVLGAWVMNGPVMSSFQYLSPVSVSPDWTLAGPK